MFYRENGKGDRDEMKAQAKILVPRSKAQLAQKTDILVCGENVAHNSKSTKLKAAKKYGAEILDEDQYYILIN